MTGAQVAPLGGTRCPGTDEGSLSTARGRVVRRG